MSKKLLILYKVFCGKIISKKPSKFKLKINITINIKTKKKSFWNWKPHPTTLPNVFKKMTVMAKNKKELIIPATINEQLCLILLLSVFTKLKKE